MALIPLSSLTCTGVLIPMTVVPKVLVPLPSWPHWLEPQAHTVPSSFSARPWEPPAAMPSTPPGRPLTCTGVLLEAISSSPSWPLILCSWPLVLEPQAQTVPSFFRARLYELPPAMASTPSRPSTCTGVLLEVIVPLPSWPLPLSPQAQTVPSPFRAKLCL